MKAIRLKTEYLTDPIGIDIQNPRLSWNCEGGIKQTAYRIIARNDDTITWDSGKVESDSMHAVYPRELDSRERIEWSVTLWDENDVCSDESKAFFEMGLLRPEDFRAKWITGNYKVNRRERYPVDCFRRIFTVKGVNKARLYATACGLYEAHINGKRVGDFVLAPGITNYKKRLQYQTYDVTELLSDGENVLTAELADGLYRGSCGAWGIRNQYGKETKLFMQLEIECEDGVSCIYSDESFDWTNGGPIRFADNKDGEIADARIEKHYICKAKITKYDVLPSASNCVNLTEHERFKGKVITTPSGKKVIDFGQNIAGYVEFTVDGKLGQELHLRFGELIGADGELTLKNIQCTSSKITTPLQEVHYTAKNGVNHYKTRFAIFGFQYVEVLGDIEWSVENFTAIAVYSNMEETLNFNCSHPLINKFVENTRWAAKNNHAEIPTDCPTRERHGWTGDAQIFAMTAAYLFDYTPFARKFVRMMGDDQYKNGKIRQIVPPGGTDFYMAPMDGCAGWADAEIIIPYKMWKLRADEGILIENYENMKKYADYTVRKIGKLYLTSEVTGVGPKYSRRIINYGQAYGEWAEPDDVAHSHWTDFVFTKPEVSTAYGSYVLSLMGEISEHMGDSEAAERYRSASDILKDGYQALRRTKKYPLDTDRQAQLVRPLYFGLLDKEDTEYAKERLIKALDNYDWRVGTGFLSTPLILYVLEDIDVEYAYKLLENEEMPGWLFMPKHGATSIWEAWEGNSTENGGIASLNHYSKGAVCEWIFGQMCGIDVGGENEYLIEPKVGGSITHASCEYVGVYGKVKSSWERNDGTTTYRFSIPANTTARVTLPSGKHTLSAGEYEFTV